MTRPVRVISRRERLKRLTIWHPINTDPHDPDRWGVRLWLPLYDVLVLLAGIAAFYVGSRLLNRLFPDWLVDFGAVVFGAAGVAALVGVIFPKLYRVEIIGKCVISFILSIYAWLVLVYGGTAEDSTEFVLVILVMSSWFVYPRLTKLFMRLRKDRKEGRV